ncbi:MAG: tetratricopeptide repeat protein [Candidatus Aureabacteria bacterium]|nr:tetratricopeptide repeat protein [Candidatus Auribacterota bacterium]
MNVTGRSWINSKTPPANRLFNLLRIRRHLFSEAVWIPVLLLAAGFFSHSPSLKGGFVWDDLTLIVNHSSIQEISPKNIRYIFTHSYFSNPDIPETKETAFRGGYFRPMANLGYALLYSIFKLNPTGWHMTNIFLHCLNGLLLFVLFQRMISDKAVCFLSALLFTLHPCFHQAVDYCTGFIDILSLFFTLTSVLFLFKWLDEKVFLSLSGFLCFTSFLLCLLTKETGLSAPLLGLCYLLSKRQKLFSNQLVKILILFINLIFIFMWRKYVLSLSLLDNSVLTPTWQYYATVIHLLVKYIYNFLVPFCPLFMQQYQAFIPFHTVLWETAGILFVLTGFYYFSLPVKLALLWFFISWIPVSNLFPLHPNISSFALYYSDHLLYFAGTGLSLLVALCLLSPDRFIKNQLIRFLLISFIVLPLIYSWTSQTRKNSSVWGNPEQLYLKVIRSNPCNAGAFLNLGVYYAMNNRHGEALLQYKTLYDVLIKNQIQEPGMISQCLTNMGYSYFQLNNWPKAAQSYQEALDWLPTNSFASNGLAESRKRMKKERFFSR